MESNQSQKIYQLVINEDTHMEVPQDILTKVEGSSLEAMFSGRHDIEDEDGLVHFNRDPDIFKLVIDFLASDKYPDFAN